MKQVNREYYFNLLCWNFIFIFKGNDNDDSNRDKKSNNIKNGWIECN